jgi:hypothetical protein
MLLFIRHPAREIVTALPAVMLFPVPVATNVESNIFAPLPTRSALEFGKVTTNLHLRAVPVNVPKYPKTDKTFIVQSASVPVAVVPLSEPNPLEEIEHLKNVPDGLPNPEAEEQSVNIPDAVAPNELFPVDVHRVNVPDAVPDPPNDSVPAVQSSNSPEAIVVDAGFPPCVPPNEDAPPMQRRYVPEYSIPRRIPDPLSPLNTQFSICVRLNRSVAVPMLPAALTVEG